jgi:glycine C-acetyltransferase
MDMVDLETQIKKGKNYNKVALKYRNIIIVTDGVFSMDGDIAPLCSILSLARQYSLLTFVDDCHATGVIGPSGRGSIEFYNLMGQVDFVSSTLGKAMGGASGGYLTGRKEVVAILRQMSRPYLFSNSIAPPIVGASLKAFQILEKKLNI